MRRLLTEKSSILPELMRRSQDDFFLFICRRICALPVLASISYDVLPLLLNLTGNVERLPRSARQQRAVIQQTKMHNASRCRARLAQVAQCNLCVAKCQGLARLVYSLSEGWRRSRAGRRAGFIRRRCSANALDDFRTRNSARVTRQRWIRTTPQLFLSNIFFFLSNWIGFQEIVNPSNAAPRKCTAPPIDLAFCSAQGNESEFCTCRSCMTNAFLCGQTETNKRADDVL